MDRKDILLNKQRIVIEVGTSTITYEETGKVCSYFDQSQE